MTIKSLHEVEDNEFGLMLKELSDYLRDENDRLNRIIRIASESAGDVRENLETACRFFKERGILVNLNELMAKVEALRRKQHNQRISMARRGRTRKKVEVVSNSTNNSTNFSNSDNSANSSEVVEQRWVDEQF